MYIYIYVHVHIYKHPIVHIQSSRAGVCPDAVHAQGPGRHLRQVLHGDFCRAWKGKA